MSWEIKTTSDVDSKIRTRTCMACGTKGLGKWWCWDDGDGPNAWQNVKRKVVLCEECVALLANEAFNMLRQANKRKYREMAT